MFFWGPGGGGGTTGGGGYGMGFPAFGAFVRNFGGPNALRSPSRGGTSGSTSSGGGGGDPQFYFDSWLQLWVDATYEENSYSALFYLDENRTMPAGHATSTFTGDWQTYPQTYEFDYAFTAGLLGGAHGHYQSVFSDEATGQMSYENTYADGSHDEGSANWNSEGSSWNSSWHSEDDADWFNDSGIWNADGSGQYSCANAQGWSSTWHYNSDWSGSADFYGPYPLLPAHMTWTADGHYRIVYANGRVETWSWEDLWESGSGTSGSTGVGTSGG